MTVLSHLRLVRTRRQAFRTKIKDAGDPHEGNDFLWSTDAFTHGSRRTIDYLLNKRSNQQSVQVWPVDAEKPLPLKFALGDFADKTFLKYDLIGANNSMVGWIQQFELPIPETYGEFYTLGWRVAQLLPGRVLDYWRPRFDAARDATEDAILNSFIEKRTAQFEEPYRRIIAMSEHLPTDQKETIVKAMLMRLEEGDETLRKLQRHLPPVPDSRPFLFSQPAANYARELEETPVEYFGDIPDDHKAPFISLLYQGYLEEVEHPAIAYAQRRGFRPPKIERRYNPLRQEFADINALVELSGPSNALGIAQILSEGDIHYRIPAHELEDALQQLEADQIDPFFAALQGQFASEPLYNRLDATLEHVLSST